MPPTPPFASPSVPSAGRRSQVEDLASGAIYCQILNAVHPGSVQMSKVKLGAKTQVDFIHNFKQLQASFPFFCGEQGRGEEGNTGRQDAGRL